MRLDELSLGNEAVVHRLVVGEMARQERLVEKMLARWPWPAGRPSLLYNHRQQLVGLCRDSERIGEFPDVLV